jgi:hypothetical protein
MKRSTCAAILLGTISLYACSSNVSQPSTPHDIIAAYLTKNGFHVVDVSMIASTGAESVYSGSEATIEKPETVCLSAPFGAMYRAYSADGQQHIGIACLEKDNSITIPLQR